MDYIQDIPLNYIYGHEDSCNELPSLIPEADYLPFLPLDQNLFASPREFGTSDMTCIDQDAHLNDYRISYEQQQKGSGLVLQDDLLLNFTQTEKAEPFGD